MRLDEIKDALKHSILLSYFIVLFAFKHHLRRHFTVVGVLDAKVDVGAAFGTERFVPLWYDGLTKLVQLLQLILIMFAIVLAFNLYSIELELTVSIIAIALAGDSLEVLYGVGYNIFDSKKRKLLFTTRQ